MNKITIFNFQCVGVCFRYFLEKISSPREFYIFQLSHTCLNTGGGEKFTNKIYNFIFYNFSFQFFHVVLFYKIFDANLYGADLAVLFSVFPFSIVLKNWFTYHTCLVSSNLIFPLISFDNSRNYTINRNELGGLGGETRYCS